MVLRFVLPRPKIIVRQSGCHWQTQWFYHIRKDIEIAAGANFVVPITGEMMRMPGLPEVPSSEAIDIDDEGNISGLF